MLTTGVARPVVVLKPRGAGRLREIQVRAASVGARDAWARRDRQPLADGRGLQLGRRWPDENARVHLLGAVECDPWQIPRLKRRRLLRKTAGAAERLDLPGLIIDQRVRVCSSLRRGERDSAVWAADSPGASRHAARDRCRETPGP